MKKAKTEPKKPIHTIKLGRVHYLYQVGISWIAIQTDPKTNWAEMPEYMRVCFGIETPDWFSLKPQPSETESLGIKIQYKLQRDDEDQFILKAIKKITYEQRKAYAGTAGANKPMGKRDNKSGKKTEPKRVRDAKGKKGEPVAPMLPFDGDVGADVRRRLFNLNWRKAGKWNQE